MKAVFLLLATLPLAAVDTPAPLFKVLEELFTGQYVELHPSEDYKEACYGVPKDKW